MRRLRGPGPTPAGTAVVAVYLGFIAMSFLQQPGRTTYDTRLELTERPGAFLASAFSLWQPHVNFGELQNQANGYLFPQGLFFWLGDLLHVAPWVTQRLWSALVVVAACEGMRRVCRALDLPPSASFLGGLVFALSPRLVGTSGVLTAEALPGAMAPWALLPLLLTVRGRLAARPSIVLAAAATASMGGVNAVETAAALLPAAILILWAAAVRLVPWRFVGAWLAAVLAATLWWTLPLLLLGRYSPPFYEFVESAATTTSSVGWSEAVRGNTHWLSWLLLPDGRPWWPGAHLLATDPVMVTVSALITAAGLVGLARSRSPFRVPFAFSAAAGLAIITVAHGGMAGTPFAGDARSVLDGALQIFRNVHKFDPAVRVAVAVGVAALFTEIVTRIDARTSPGVTGRWVIVPACLVLVLGAPYLVNSSRTPGWSSLPDSWVAARDWLADHDDGGAVLIAPASGFALQSWGATLDEPALALDIRNRVALTQAPLLPGATLRYLYALNSSITSARTDALAGMLRRSGISFVVVRSDLDPAQTGTPSPTSYESALAAAGLEEVAAFGEDGVAPVAVYRVGRPEPSLRMTPVDHVLTVAGEAESVLTLQEAGLGDDTIVLQGEAGWQRTADVVTDSAQRRERQFGSIYGTRSVVLQADEPYRLPRAVHDYPGVPGARQVVAAYDGLSSLRASSSRGYADTYGEVVVAEGPAAAIDSDRTTRWVSSPATVATRQWLRLTFREQRPVREVTVRPVVGDRFLAPVRRIEVRAGSQRRTLDVNPDGAAAVARFDGSPARSVTVRILRIGGVEKRAPVALAGVRIDDLVPRATLKVPEPLGAGVGFVFSSDAGTRPCVGQTFGPDCNEARRRTPEEPSGIDRTVQVRGRDVVALTGSVVARTTRLAARLLEPVGREQRVRASSIFGNDPQVASRFAWDGLTDTAWVPADSDVGPTLVFRWRTPRDVSGIRVASPDAQARPTRAVLRTREGQSVGVSLGGSAASSFPTLKTRRLEVTFQRPERGARLVVGEVELSGADVTQPFDRDAVTGAICGLGPHVVVDKVVYQSEVRGTLGDIVDGRPLQLRVCDPEDVDATPQVHLGSGEHRIRTPRTAQFQTVVVAGTAAGATSAGTTRRVDVETSSGVRRTASIGPGSASVLSMTANANPGWRATLEGRTLDPVRVDGWRQGWLVPAGSGGRLVIDFPAQEWYRAVVIGGLVPAGLTLIAALVLLIRTRRPRRELPDHFDASARSADARGGARRRRTGRAAPALAAILLVALGVACTLGALVAWAGRCRPWIVMIAGLAVAASGPLDAGDLAVPVDGFADLLAAAGFGMLFVAAISRPEAEAT